MTPLDPMNDSYRFMKSVIEVLGWKDLKGELVIDIGCGMGSTAKAVLHFFPEVEKVVAIDVQADKVKEARKINQIQKIEYERADIRNQFTLCNWIDCVDKAVSVFCFNNLDDVEVAYENLFLLLKDDGEAAILQSLQSGYYNFLEEMRDHAKWKMYFKKTTVIIPVSHFEKHNAGHYEKMLQDIGFEVIHCHEEQNVYGKSFANDEDCKTLLYNTCHMSHFIPRERRAEFREDLFDVFFKYNKRNHKGQMTLSHTTFSVFVRRPKGAMLKRISCVDSDE